MKLSIVATLYQSALYIKEFYKRSSDIANKMAPNDYEIILVNDGSSDKSLEIALDIAEKDPRVTVIDLSRNFGHHRAMMTGLGYALGELVFLIDSDLEEQPEWLLDFDVAMKSESADVIFGVQQKRKGKWFERWTGEIFYRLFNYLADIKHPRNIVTARLMSHDFVQALLLHKETEIVISCLWIITGFRQLAYPVKKQMRNQSTYTFSKKMTHVANSITSFSTTPLMIIFYVGLIIFLLSLAYVAYLIILRFMLDSVIEGWTSVIASIWFLGGMMIFFIGIIGVYLAKIFSEIKRRPLSIVRKIYGTRQPKN
jgi:putative glycosyltransferase